MIVISSFEFKLDANGKNFVVSPNDEIYGQQRLITLIEGQKYQILELIWN